MGKWTGRAQRFMQPSSPPLLWRSTPILIYQSTILVTQSWSFLARIVGVWNIFSRILVGRGMNWWKGVVHSLSRLRFLLTVLGTSVMGFARMQGEFYSRMKAGPHNWPHSKAIGSSTGGSRTTANNVLEAPKRQTKGVPCHYWGWFFTKETYA